MRPLAWISCVVGWLVAAPPLSAQHIDLAYLRANYQLAVKQVDSLIRLNGLSLPVSSSRDDSFKLILSFYRLKCAEDSARGDWKSYCAHIGYTKPQALNYTERLIALTTGNAEATLEAQLEAEIEAAQAHRRAWMLGAGLLVLGLGLVQVGFLAYARRRRLYFNTQLAGLNRQLEQQREALAAQTREIHHLHEALGQSLSDIDRQRFSLELEHQRLADSLHYAARIQQALLPPDTRSDALEVAFLHRPAGPVASS